MSVIVDQALLYAQEQPLKVIIIDKWRTWTWSELMQRALGYRATVLKHFSLDSRYEAVPILVGRGGDVAAAVLGILMAGQAAAPLSPRQPAARLQQCLDKLGASEMLDARATEERQPLEASLTLLEPGASEGEVPSSPNAAEESLLYILFTSGSTGEPKGVMVSHANILNTLLWSVDLIDWRPDDVMGGATQFSFDIANFDLFTCFYYGFPLSILPDPSDARDVVQRIGETGITSIFAVPAFFSQFVRAELLNNIDGTSLRRILAGGDFFIPAHTLDWRTKAPQVEIFNVWGPTETSIVNTMHKLTAADLELLEKGRYCSIGRQHPRMPFVLVDEAGHSVTEPSERGEIWMLGDCVSLGYVGGEEEEDEAYTTYDGQRAFRTRDIGYLDEHGLLYMAGRTGSIVKIAGYRIDLGDVESALGGLPEVHLAGAFVNDATEAINELWAAVELKPGIEKLDVFAAKRGLRKVLPNYMVPKRLFALSSLPLSTNGKVDRKAIKTTLLQDYQAQPATQGLGIG